MCIVVVVCVVLQKSDFLKDYKNTYGNTYSNPTMLVQSKEHWVVPPRLAAFSLRQNALTPPPGLHSRMHLHIDLEITVAESQIKVRFCVSASNALHVVLQRFRCWRLLYLFWTMNFDVLSSSHSFW